MLAFAGVLGLILVMAGCGDGSDIGLCKDLCERGGECNDLSESQIQGCKDSCERAGGSSEMCSNAGEIRSKTRECLNKDSCSEFQSCTEQVPACEE
jgi:hypothetical protein